MSKCSTSCTACTGRAGIQCNLHLGTRTASSTLCAAHAQHPGLAVNLPLTSNVVGNVSNADAAGAAVRARPRHDSHSLPVHSHGLETTEEMVARVAVGLVAGVQAGAEPECKDGCETWIRALKLQPWELATSESSGTVVFISLGVCRCLPSSARLAHKLQQDIAWRLDPGAYTAFRRTKDCSTSWSRCRRGSARRSALFGGQPAHRCTCGCQI